MTLFRRVIALALRGDFDAAIADATGMWQAWLRAGAPPAHWTAPAAYAGVLVCGLRGDSDGAHEWRGRAAELAAGRTSRNMACFAAFADSRVALHHGRADQAAAALAGLGIGERPWYDTQHWDYDAYAWTLAAEAAVIAALPGAGQLLAAAALAARENLWAAACLARASAAGGTTTRLRWNSRWPSGSRSARGSNGAYIICSCYPIWPRKGTPNWRPLAARRRPRAERATRPRGDRRGLLPRESGRS